MNLNLEQLLHLRLHLPLLLLGLQSLQDLQLAHPPSALLLQTLALLLLSELEGHSDEVLLLPLLLELPVEQLLLVVSGSASSSRPSIAAPAASTMTSSSPSSSTTTTCSSSTTTATTS